MGKPRYRKVIKYNPASVPIGAIRHYHKYWNSTQYQ
jgi:hypothetical protein